MVVTGFSRGKLFLGRECIKLTELWLPKRAEFGQQTFLGQAGRHAGSVLIHFDNLMVIYRTSVESMSMVVVI